MGVAAAPSRPSLRPEALHVTEGRQAFSHSRLEALEQCPRQYRFRYVDKLARSFQSVEAFCGTMVHDALGWLYREREERRAPSADELAERYRAAWDERCDASVRVVREGTIAEDYARDGEVMLRAHHATTFADDRRETLAMEPRIEVDIGGHGYVGFIDRLARDPADGQLHVIDFKTGRRMPESAEAAGLQVRAYGLAVLERHGGLEVRLEYDYLRHGRRLTETMPRSLVPEVAAALDSKMRAALAAETVGDFPPRPSPTCAWCGYREICDVSGFHRGAAGLAASATRPSPGEGSCPACGSGLRVRSGRTGRFVGCSAYPACRYTRDVTEEALP